MNFPQTIEKPREQPPNKAIGKVLSMFLNMKLQRAPAHVLHHHVHGLVGAEKIFHAHNIGMRNRCQRTAFLKKTFQAMAKYGKVFVRVDLHLGTGHADNQRGGQILLDRHRRTALVPRQIDNRKPARGQQLFNGVTVEAVTVG